MNRIKYNSHFSNLKENLIQLSENEAFRDLDCVCKDGQLKINRFTLGLLFPEIEDYSYIILPEHSTAEVVTQTRNELQKLQFIARGSTVQNGNSIGEACILPGTSSLFAEDDDTRARHSSGHRETGEHAFYDHTEMERESSPPILVDPANILDSDPVLLDYTYVQISDDDDCGEEEAVELPDHIYYSDLVSNPGLLQHQDLYQKQQYSQSQNTRTFGPKPTQVATAKTQYNVLDEYYRYKYKDQIKFCEVKLPRKRLSLSDISGLKREQVQQRSKKKRRCFKCSNCRVRDCLKCAACLDMKKYGGPQRMKKACRNRPQCRSQRGFSLDDPI